MSKSCLIVNADITGLPTSLRQKHCVDILWLGSVFWAGSNSSPCFPSSLQGLLLVHCAGLSWIPSVPSHQCGWSGRDCLHWSHRRSMDAESTHHIWLCLLVAQQKYAPFKTIAVSLKRDLALRGCIFKNNCEL